MSQIFLTEPWVCNVENAVICPLCESTSIVTDLDNGEEICTTCGCVVNDLSMHRGREAGGFTLQETQGKRRHGMWIRESVHDRGFNTVIKGTRDASGSLLSRETLSDISRLRKRDNRTKIDETVLRNLSVAMAELDRVCDSLHLPFHAKEYAASIYRKALELDLIRGRSIDAFVAASIYLACRIKAIPRSLQTVAEESKREYQEVSMTYRFMLVETGLKPPIDEPAKYVPKIASSLDIPRPVELAAVDLLLDAKGTSAVVGKDPRGVAAAALYMALLEAGDTIVQRRLAEAADTTEVTLRNRYYDLKRVLRDG